MSATDLKNELALVSEADFALLRDVSTAHLRNERARGLGPPYTTIGKRVFYPLKSLREYTAKRLVIPSKKAATLIDGDARGDTTHRGRL